MIAAIIVIDKSENFKCINATLNATLSAKSLSLLMDRLFVTIRIIKGGVHDFRGCQIFSLFCRLILQTSVRGDILSE